MAGLRLLNHYAGKRVLVTGAAGFVGHELCLALYALGAEVMGTYFLRPPDPLNEAWDSSQMAQMDVRDYEAVARIMSLWEPHFVFHLAALTQVPEAGALSRATFDTNFMGTVNVLEAIQHHAPDATCFVMSTDKYYGNSHEVLSEDMFPIPGHPYDTSKAAMELAARSYANNFGLSVVIARPTNIFGEGDMNWRRIVPATMQAVVRRTRLILRSDGTPVREYVHVDRVVRAILKLSMERFDAFLPTGMAVNLGGYPISVFDLVYRICKVAEIPWKDFSCWMADSSPNESSEIKIDDSLASDLIGWKYDEDLFDSDLRLTFAGYKTRIQADIHARQQLKESLFHGIY